MIHEVPLVVIDGTIRSRTLVCRVILFHAPAELANASTDIKTLQKLSTASNSQQSFIKAHTANRKILHYTTDPVHKKIRNSTITAALTTEITAQKI